MNGGRKRHKQKRQVIFFFSFLMKTLHGADVPGEKGDRLTGGGDTCKEVCLFPLAQKKNAKEAACLQDKCSEAFPLLVLRGKRQMTGGRKLAPNQRALCSETPRQTEAFSG